jgi:hypothetical protein|nr:hypothetical protein [Neorhizobium tomejilense]
MSDTNIEWDVHFDNGTWVGTVNEKIAADRGGQEPDEYARCAAALRFDIPATKGFSVSPRSLTWDDVEEMQRFSKRPRD